MRKKLAVLFSLMLMLPFFLNVGVVFADSYYEGSGTSRAQCTLRNTYSSNELRKMGNAYNSSKTSIAAVGIVAALTPVIGKYLAAGASAISLYAGVKGDQLVTKANQGYKGKEYYCQKVNWDGYSSRSYVRIKFVK